MERILDYIVSESWTFYTMFIVLTFVPAILFIHTPVKNLVYRRIIQIGGAIFCFCTLMYLLLSHHGYAVQFVSAVTNGQKIALIELHYEGDGDGGSYETYRLYVVDAKTGERGMRTTVSSSTMLCMSEQGVIFFEWGKAVEYDLNSGKVLREWSQEKGFEKFPELKDGIANLSYQTTNNMSNNKAWLTIQAKNGHEYCYYLLEDILVEERFPNVQNESEIDFNDYEIHLGNDYYNRTWTFDFRNKTGDIETLYRTDKSGSVEYPDEYLYPEIIGAYDDGNLFIIRTYTTVEKKSACYIAISFSGEKLWKLNQEEIISEDNWGTQPSPGIAFTHGQFLYITVGGGIACVDMNTGQLVWKSIL